MLLRTTPLFLTVAVTAAMLAAVRDAHAQREPTTQTSIGIFYLPGAPVTADLWRDGDQGERLRLQGRVLDRRGRRVTGALVELWHADATGGVDETRYRAAQRTRADGRFGIRTVLPGHIEMARYNSVFAPRHIHIVVTHPDHPRLVSLIFFRGDERLDGSPYPELAIPLEKVVVQGGEVLVGDVEIILGATPLPAGDWQGTD
jgi:protocatechuate 3,4-dioxygenase beta subunit